MKTKNQFLPVVTAVGCLAASRVLAATGGWEEGMGLLTVLLLAFGAIIILAQAIPAAMLFASMLKALFSPARHREPATDADEVA